MFRLSVYVFDCSSSFIKNIFFLSDCLKHSGLLYVTGSVVRLGYQ